MGSPSACYHQLMYDYVSNSVKLNKEKREKYTPDYFYSLPEEEMEKVVHSIHPSSPMYNAFKAGAVFQEFLHNCGNDEFNAAVFCLDDYLNLFNISFPEDEE